MLTCFSSDSSEFSVFGGRLLFVTIRSASSQRSTPPATRPKRGSKTHIKRKPRVLEQLVGGDRIRAIACHSLVHALVLAL